MSEVHLVLSAVADTLQEQGLSVVGAYASPESAEASAQRLREFAERGRRHGTGAGLPMLTYWVSRFEVRP